MGHSMRDLHPKIFFRKKYVLSRSTFKNNRHVFFQYDIGKFREMNLQNFEIGKIDDFSIE